MPNQCTFRVLMQGANHAAWVCHQNLCGKLALQICQSCRSGYRGLLHCGSNCDDKVIKAASFCENDLVLVPQHCCYREEYQSEQRVPSQRALLVGWEERHFPNLLCFLVKVWQHLLVFYEWGLHCGETNMRGLCGSCPTKKAVFGAPFHNWSSALGLTREHGRACLTKCFARIAAQPTALHLFCTSSRVPWQCTPPCLLQIDITDRVQGFYLATSATRWGYIFIFFF